MKLCLMSDLHLEFWNMGDLKGFINQVPECDLIALAGDIGSLKYTFNEIKDLINALSTRAPVVYVPGNHDFYDDSFKNGIHRLEQLQKQCKKARICETVKKFDYKGYSFIAGTLWFPNLTATPTEKSWMPDFKWIYELEGYIYKENDSFVSALNGYSTYPSRTIVISHHAPSAQSVCPKYRNSPINQFFLTELEEDIMFRGPVAWLHGHMHEPVDYYIGVTRIVSNPRGYFQEKKWRNWQPKIIEIN